MKIKKENNIISKKAIKSYDISSLNKNLFKDSKILAQLAAYQDFNSFKLYLLDPGLLCAMAKIDSSSILEGNELLVEFKGSLTEQFVLTELKSNTDVPIFYWSSDKGIAELDYIIQLGKNNIPIEVKSGDRYTYSSLDKMKIKYKDYIGKYVNRDIEADTILKPEDFSDSADV